MDNRLEPYWASTERIDLLGKLIVVGDTLAKADKSGQVPYITLCKVTEIRNDKIYLDNSKVPIQFPGRCLVVNSLL